MSTARRAIVAPLLALGASQSASAAPIQPGGRPGGYADADE